MAEKAKHDDPKDKSKFNKGKKEQQNAKASRGSKGRQRQTTRDKK